MPARALYPPGESVNLVNLDSCPLEVVAAAASEAPPLLGSRAMEIAAGRPIDEPR